jgi:hypothetical protein
MVWSPPSATADCFDPNNNNAPISQATIVGEMASGAAPSVTTTPDPNFPKNQIGKEPDWQPLPQPPQ